MVYLIWSGLGWVGGGIVFPAPPDTYTMLITHNPNTRSPALSTDKTNLSSIVRWNPESPAFISLDVISEYGQETNKDGENLFGEVSVR